MSLYLLLLLCTSINFSYSENDTWQEPLITAKVGGSVNLTCLITKQRITTIIWLKQNVGEKPYVIATSYQHQPARFYNEFAGDGRFDTKIGLMSFNLSIRNVKLSDSATYYCAVTFLYDIVFGQGTDLFVKDETVKGSTLIQQEKVQTVEPENSESQCTVVSDRCVGDHSVYWFRHGSGKSQTGIIYTQGQSSGQCKKSINPSSTQTCVYRLPQNFSRSNPGTYYCAVAACGEILFGNGTQMNIKDDYYQIEVLVLLSIIRAGVLLITFAVCLFFTWTQN